VQRQACLNQLSRGVLSLDEDADAADLALDEIQKDPDRSDDTIAHKVAMRISQP
jgi:hypothetical protein